MEKHAGKEGAELKRFVLDIAMLVVVLFTMGFHFLPQMWHEILGLVLFVGVLWHLGLNRRWFRGLVRGKWGWLRWFQTGLSALLILCFLLTVVTGIIISNHVFREVWTGAPLHRSIFIHQLHIASAYLMVIFSGMHLGMHWSGLWQRICRFPGLRMLAGHPSLRFWMLVIIGWAGILLSRLDHVGDRLLMKHIFGTVAARLPGIVYYLLLLCMLGFYAIIFYYMQRYLQRRAVKQRGSDDR